MEFEFDSVEAVLEDIRRGKLVIVTDDEGARTKAICSAPPRKSRPASSIS